VIHTSLTSHRLLIVGIIVQARAPRVYTRINPSLLEERLERRHARVVEHCAVLTECHSGEEHTPRLVRVEADTDADADADAHPPWSELRTNMTPSNVERVSLVNMFGSLDV
jgi:hypothetical protein